TRLFPANASFGWEATIPYNPTYDSPVDPSIDETDPAEVAAALAGLRPNPTFIPTGTADPDGPGPLLGAQHPVTPELALLLNSRTSAFEPGGPTPPNTGWV